MQVERLRRVAAREPLERIRRSTDAPQGAFGVVDKSGLILADAAGDVAARFELVAKRRQDDWDKAKVNEAVSQYLKWDQKTRYDPEKGLMLVSGANARGLYDRSVDIYAKQAQEMAGALENDRQRIMFREAVAPHERAAAMSLSKQEAVELRKWNVAQSEERLRNEAAAFSRSFDTPEGRGAAEAAVRQVSLTINGDQGEETNAKNEKDVMRQLISYGLDSLVRTDPLRAEKMITAFKDEFDGVTFERIKAEVDKAALEVHLQEDTPKLFAEYGFDGLEEARKYIREHYEGAEESKRLTAAESLWREKWNDRKFKEEQASDQIFGMMDGGASLKQVNDAISAINWSSNGARIQMMRARDAHFKIGEYAPKATAVKTSRETLLALDELRNSGKLFEIAPTKTDFTNMFGGSLSDRDWRAYLKYYDDANKPGGRQKAAIKMNCDSAFSKKLKEAGVEDVQQQAFYQDRFNYEYEEAIKKKNGVMPTNEEAVAMMDVILAPEVVGKTKSFWGRTVDKVVRRGDIPPKEMINPDTRLPYGTEKDKDGRYFIIDKDGKKRPLIFPDGGGKPVPAPYTLD